MHPALRSIREGQCGDQHLSSQDRLLKSKGLMGAWPMVWVEHPGQRKA